jgi:hypothetical protein
VEDKVSALEDKVDIKEKTEELLDKRLKSWERNTQELSNSIKKTKPMNHEHQRMRRDASQRDM